MNWKFWQGNKQPTGTKPKPRYIGKGGERAVSLLLPSDTNFQDLFGRNRNQVWSSWIGNRLLPLYLLRATSISDPLVRSIVQLTQNGVVGDVEIKPDFSCIKNNRKRAAVKELWEEFCRAPDVGGKTTMLALQRAIVGQYFVDGRVLATVKFHSDYPMGIAIQTINRELLESSITFGSNDPHNLGEIISKESGRITHYRILKNSPVNGILRSLSPIVSGGGGGQTVDVPAEFVFDWLGDSRADRFDASVSPLLSSLRGLRTVEEMDDAALKSLKVSTQVMGFYKKDAGADTVQGSGSDDEELANSAPTSLQYGSINELPPGWDFREFSPTHPNINSVAVRKDLLQILCMAAGTEYLSVAGDASGANFSSLKHFALKNTKQYRRLARAMTNSILAPILKIWINHISLSGKVALTASDIRAVCGCAWIYPTQPGVEPLKDLQYGQGAVQTFAVSPDNFAAQNGGNVLENIQTMSKIYLSAGGEDKGSDILNAQAMVAAMGLTPPTPAGTPPEPAAAPADDTPPETPPNTPPDDADEADDDDDNEDA